MMKVPNEPGLSPNNGPENAFLSGVGFLCSQELRRKLGAWESSGVNSSLLIRLQAAVL